ncbi:MAG TPA: hypothetical protein GX510_07485 [Firmicutes bacterium]|nr:hypothetical protein [Candidatus Fermentithermobacillaceae bacterium]
MRKLKSVVAAVLLSAALLLITRPALAASVACVRLGNGPVVTIINCWGCMDRWYELPDAVERWSTGLYDCD